MDGKQKQYVVTWFVADNPKSIAHFDRMLVLAVSRTSALKIAINRIKIEYDYDFEYCSITGIWRCKS